MAARNDQVIRIIKLMRLLELNPQGLSVKEILTRLESEGIDVDRSTIYRDLSALEGAHVGVQNIEKGNDRAWKLDDLIQVSRGITFNYNELIALFLTRESLRSFEGSPFFDTLKIFFDRLEHVFGPKAHKGLRELASTMQVRPGPTWVGGVSQSLVDTIHRACAEGHMVEIEYRSSGGSTAGAVSKRKVGPVNLYFADSGAYLIAVDQNDQATKTFALMRVIAAKFLDNEVFEHHGGPIALGTGIGVFMGGGVVEDIEVFIQEPIASYVADRRFHSSQRSVRKENGVQVTMTVVNNDELARWILGLGPCAKVISPDSLRESVTSLATAVADQYRRKSA